MKYTCTLCLFVFTLIHITQASLESSGTSTSGATKDTGQIIRFPTSPNKPQK